jgi:hypothetical protein
VTVMLVSRNCSAVWRVGRFQQRLPLCSPYTHFYRSSFFLHARFPKRLISTSQPAASKPWVEHLPAKVQPYLYLSRVDKPIGTLLLFYPCGSSSSRSPTLRVPEPPTLFSLVNHNGFLRTAAPFHDASDLYKPLRCRGTRYARRGLHNQRHVGQEP